MSFVYEEVNSSVICSFFVHAAKLNDKNQFDKEGEYRHLMIQFKNKQTCWRYLIHVTDLDDFVCANSKGSAMQEVKANAVLARKISLGEYESFVENRIVKPAKKAARLLKDFQIPCLGVEAWI